MIKKCIMESTCNDISHIKILTTNKNKKDLNSTDLTLTACFCDVPNKYNPSKNNNQHTKQMQYKRKQQPIVK